mgnify:CR=1 FL=1
MLRLVWARSPSRAGNEVLVFRAARSVRLLSATAYALMAAVSAAAVGVGL